MGNPVRHILNNQLIVTKLEVDNPNKRVLLKFFDEEPESHYDKARIDVYSAPDLILTYTNGNTNRDEWKRNMIYEFKNLNHEANETYSYDDLELSILQYDDPETETDIPLGKFIGMTFEDVQEYKRKNVLNFKIQEMAE